MGSARIEVLRFLPKDANDAKEDREELREGGFVMVIGEGLFKRRGEVVDCRVGEDGYNSLSGGGERGYCW